MRNKTRNKTDSDIRNKCVVTAFQVENPNCEEMFPTLAAAIEALRVSLGWNEVYLSKEASLGGCCTGFFYGPDYEAFAMNAYTTPDQAVQATEEDILDAETPRIVRTQYAMCGNKSCDTMNHADTFVIVNGVAVCSGCASRQEKGRIANTVKGNVKMRSNVKTLSQKNKELQARLRQLPPKTKKMLRTKLVKMLKDYTAKMSHDSDPMRDAQRMISDRLRDLN